MLKGRLAVRAAVAFAAFDQLPDLFFGEVFPRPDLGNFPFYGGWRCGFQGRFCHINQCSGSATFGKVLKIRKVYRPILACPKTNIVKCGDGRRCRRIENASGHLPLSKKAPAANRGQVNRGPWEVSKLSDSHAAGRNVPRGSALPLRSPYRRSAQWPSPDVAGTPPSGIPGFGVSP